MPRALVSSGSALLGEITAVLLPVLLGKVSTEELVLGQAALRRWEGKLWPAMARGELWGRQLGWCPSRITPQPQSLSCSFAGAVGRFRGRATHSEAVPFPEDICVQA